MAYYKRIRELREDKDLTQKQVAEKLYMHTTQYRRYESGERTPPLDMAVALSKLYGVSVDYISNLTEYNNLITEDGLSAEEKQLLTYYRRLSSNNKAKLFERAVVLSEIK